MATKKSSSSVTKNMSSNMTDKKSMRNPLSRFNFSPIFVAQTLLVVIIGVAIFLLAQKYRGLVVAAIVNKTPITRWQLNQTLVNRYGQSVLDELIAEQLLKEQARVNQVQVNDTDIDQKITEFVDRFGGAENFQTALDSYGLTESDLRDQVRLSLMQEKLANKLFSVEVSDDEVRQYYEDNQELIEDDFATAKDQITEQLRTQKLEQEFATWFTDIRSQAQVQTYIQ